MAANATRQRFAPAVEPNVIPFIDVLLVLLIIFMVTAPKPATNGRVFVRADLDVGYQSVVSAVDTLEHARFRRVAIAAQTADAPG